MIITKSLQLSTYIFITIGLCIGIVSAAKYGYSRCVPTMPPPAQLTDVVENKVKAILKKDIADCSVMELALIKSHFHHDGEYHNLFIVTDPDSSRYNHDEFLAYREWLENELKVYFKI